jgi:hypothetical protein
MDESMAVRKAWYGGRMSGKKDDDATKKLPPDEPTQVLPKGTKTGLPKHRDVMAALAKVARKQPQ